VSQWVTIILTGAILIVLLEARVSLGTRLAVMERDFEWLVASLEKWGLVAPNLKDRK
jgi:hypothetical protein